MANNKTFRQKMYESLINEDVKQITKHHKSLLKHIKTFKKTFELIYNIADSLQFREPYQRYGKTNIKKIKKILDKNKNEVFSYALYKSIRSHSYVFASIIVPKENSFPGKSDHVSTIIKSMKGIKNEFYNIKEQSRNPIFFQSFFLF